MPRSQSRRALRSSATPSALSPVRQLAPDISGSPAPGKLLDEFLTPQQLANELGCCVKTLIRWRADKVGPPATKLGRRVIYRRSSVSRWLATREAAA